MVHCTPLLSSSILGHRCYLKQTIKYVQVMGKYVCFMTKGIQGVTNSLMVTAFHLLITDVKYIISIRVILSLNSNSLTLFSGVSKLKEAQLVELENCGHSTAPYGDQQYHRHNVCRNNNIMNYGSCKIFWC